MIDPRGGSLPRRGRRGVGRGGGGEAPDDAQQYYRGREQADGLVQIKKETPLRRVARQSGHVITDTDHRHNQKRDDPMECDRRAGVTRRFCRHLMTTPHGICPTEMSRNFTFFSVSMTEMESERPLAT